MEKRYIRKKNKVRDDIYEKKIYFKRNIQKEIGYKLAFWLSLKNEIDFSKILNLNKL